MAQVTRRALLRAAPAAAALALSACGGSPPAGVDRRSGTLRSRHWPGQDIGWQLATPSARPTTPRPLVIALHGKGGGAADAFDGLHLDDHVVSTGLSVASVDGGGYYWHARRAGVDPGAMVLEDFLPLLRRQTGYAGKVAFLGWSMGGYGALLLASQLGPGQVAGVVAESAALWTSPGRSAPGAFDDAEDFAAHDVFRRTTVLGRMPVRLDCGTSDPFAAADRAFAAALPSARLTLDEGGHDDGYWAAHAGSQLQWLRRQFEART
ncbi:alpha/beta hydrolase-fold protein [Pedococcus sp.]|jgi:S-formylglutathione hydrolase FrmB|uniref:alpha/beta hydrolase-fold protein n=1 Tax=Pedococcus sp. TaxID=2860345 RepID=UPI002E119A0A|nr:alpha/beta hydrolase-fold protein [Pedococcus sp.]